MLGQQIFDNAMIEPFLQFFNGDSVFEGLGISSLETTYKWKVPDSAETLFGKISGNSRYAQNISLKFAIQKKWNDDPSSRRKIIEWIISDWGGINGNRKTTFDEYERRMTTDLSDTPITGIASFSKVLAIYDPKKYAIYDARVAVSLIAIQLLSKSSNALAFPYLSGRNKVTGHWSPKPKVGFSTMPQYSTKVLTKPPHNWSRVKRQDSYKTYIDLLTHIRDASDHKWEIYDLEMALFAQAPELAKRQEPSLDK